jgi:hypothetical protein
MQGYPLDMSCPAENQLRLSFAKPLKANDPRARGHNKAFHNSNIYSKPLGQVNRMQADDGYPFLVPCRPKQDRSFIQHGIYRK